MEELVTSLKEVFNNVEQFNKDLLEETDIISQLTQFKHWYYTPVNNSFGPSKYIGYKDMNTSKYARGENKTGVDTEKILKQWFIKLPPESKKSQEHMVELSELLGVYGKKVRSNAFIHVLKNGITCP
ncbi:hypothetical protein [Rummeliibacillus stabekisii]|uniref:Uncharacterized protein n=1 Tax=Rummeliibacillus stabekisii TaxID=241244 RepID=A0A143HF73_9BACL|nr:hypothetical protein [Rummeliibacillus stabekisii]AMX00375.1 hypothetical protein ATY39_13705 [Rummeliibacillus stabekisii]